MRTSWTPGAIAPPGEALARPGSALLTVDLQLARVPGACPPAMREALLRVLAEFRTAELPVVHALGGGVSPAAERAFPDLDRGLLPNPEARLYGQWLVRGRLQRLGPGEVALHKPGWGAFWRTPLEGYLRATGVETLVVAGCGFPCGPRATLYEASERLFRTVLLDGAVSGLYALARAELPGLGVALRRAPGAPFP